MRLPSTDLALGRQRLYFHTSETMSEVPDRSVDVVVTSPPYNRRKRYHPSCSDRQPLDSYLALLDRVFQECYRVLRPGGTFFLNVGDRRRGQRNGPGKGRGRGTDGTGCRLSPGAMGFF